MRIGLTFATLIAACFCLVGAMQAPPGGPPILAMAGHIDRLDVLHAELRATIDAFDLVAFDRVALLADPAIGRSERIAAANRLTKDTVAAWKSGGRVESVAWSPASRYRSARAALV